MPSQFSTLTSTLTGGLNHGVDHYENFPVASWLCPARLRPVIAAIYWFARTADDIADEGDAPLAQRLADLAAYRANLHACAKGHDPSGRWAGLFEALAPHIAQHDLPLDLLDDLLTAFEQDVQYTAAGYWYADHTELLRYCRCSANPIGRLLLHLYGIYDKPALHASDAICSALQLINFWQDLSVDVPRKRYYLPRDLMALCSVQRGDIIAGKDTADTAKLVALCEQLARATMLKGAQLPRRVRRQIGGFDGWRASMELRCVIQGGLRILDKIYAMDYRTLERRPQLNAWDGCVVVWRALWM